MIKRLQCCLGIVLVSGLSMAQTPVDTSTLENGSGSVQLLYQSTPKKRTTAAVSEIYSPELRKTVSTTFGGWLTGRMAGLFTTQTIGEPGFDDVNVFLRGQQPLVLIDGTPQSFPSLNPEQIESITLLKDAVATAMLGLRGSNGAILITTKRGTRVPGQHIEFTARHGVQRPTQLPKFVDAATYATLYNEALANEGKAPAYSAAAIAAYRDGTDPIARPNVDWQREILENQAPFSRYDLSVSGGNKTTRYFVNLDYLHQAGLLKTEDFNTYNTNSDYKRYIIRSNIEIDLSKSVTTAVNLIGRIQNSNQPGATTGTIFDNIANTPNNAYPLRNSDSSLGGNLDYRQNLYGQTVLSGYRPVYERDFKADVSLKGKLDVIAKGLWVKGLAAINGYQRETINRSKNFAVFRENTDAGGVKSYDVYGVTTDQSNSIAVNSQNRLFYTELSLGYSKQLSSKDNLDIIALYNNDNRMVNSELPFNYSGAAAKISYDRNDKYFIDLAMSYNGTERLPKENRYGLFPAIGLGWNLTKENFLQNKAGWLNDLKLRASFGRTGNANVGYYDYYQYYTTGSGYGFGNTVPSSTTTLQQGTLANPFISFEKADKLNVGVDAVLLKNKLNITVDYFRDKYFDLVQSRQNGSDMLGTEYVRENFGSNRYSGLEVSAGWQEKKGAFSYFIAPNLTILQTEVLKLAEPNRMYAYMLQTGKPVGAAYGYVADGLFASQAEIDAHAFQGAGIVPGDIRYRDLNEDGMIDAADRQVIGNTAPQIYYGLNTGVEVKGFDLHVLFQGAANINKQLGGFMAFQNNGRGQVYEYQTNRWTPQNTTDAAYPRLWLGNNTNNQLTSSYWIHKGDYARIRSVELGYTLPSAMAGKARLQLVRVFLNATNPVTFSSLNKWNIDPEGLAGAYPIMKTFNAGLTIKL